MSRIRELGDVTASWRMRDAIGGSYKVSGSSGRWRYHGVQFSSGQIDHAEGMLRDQRCVCSPIAVFWPHGITATREMTHHTDGLDASDCAGLTTGSRIWRPLSASVR